MEVEAPNINIQLFEGWGEGGRTQEVIDDRVEFDEGKCRHRNID